MGEKIIIFLMGPTASGKSHLAAQLAANLPVELISVDSAMVYRGMDIGTAKPSVAERAKLPQHLIDICDPGERYSAAQFCLDAHQHIADIMSRGKIPLLVGGTLLYFHALQHGLSALPEADATLRAQLWEQGKALGWEKMHQRLIEVDPESAARIHPNDPQRIQRALEVYQLSGMPLSHLCKTTAQGLPYPIISIAIAPADRAVLHQGIAKRFEAMMIQGFLQEVRALYQRGDLSLDLPSMRSVGYRQLWQHLNGELSLEQAVEKAIIATRQLAKRQLTWLRGNPDVQWFDSTMDSLCFRVQQQIEKILLKV